MKDFCVLGSGIAGSLIGNKLSKKYSVEVFDKARGIGGRSSNRRYIKNMSFDHGLQYFSPKTNIFNNFLTKLLKEKKLKLWDGIHLDFGFKKNSTKYVGIKSNNVISKYLLKKIKNKCSAKIIKIKFNSNHWIVTLNNNKKINFKNIIFTCPFPQVKILAKKYLKKNILKLNVKMSPNITVMVAYKNFNEIPISSIKFNDEIISWASNENSKKRFKSKINLWTIQTNMIWSKKYINKYKVNQIKLSNLVLKRFEKIVGIDSNKRCFEDIHGWKFAFNYKKTNLSSYWDSKLGIGICGDWFLGPKAEDAFLSANNLYNKIKKNPLKNKRV